MRKVLVLEDEENIRSFVVINLKRARASRAEPLFTPAAVASTPGMASSRGSICRAAAGESKNMQNFSISPACASK